MENKELLIQYDQEVNRLFQENKKLKEELSKCTRKYWQQKCFEHSANEKLLKQRINKAIEYMKHYIEVEDAPINERIKIEFREVLNKLKGEENE